MADAARPEPSSPSETTPRPLSPEVLRLRCDPTHLGFASTAELPPTDELPGQARALEALRLGLRVRKHGFNVFALGPPGAGKRATVLRLAREQAAGERLPDAWCYVESFQDARRPRALRLPAGRARPFAHAMRRLLDDLRVAIPAAFERDAYRTRRQEIEAEPKLRMKRALEELRGRAAEKDVALIETPGGVSIAPTRQGEILDVDAFHALPAEEQRRIEANMEAVGGLLSELSAKLPSWLKETRDALRRLDRDTTGEAVTQHFLEVRASHADLPAVVAHLDAVQADILENAAEFLPAAHEVGAAALKALFGDTATRRYGVNVFVEPEGPGVPVVIEDDPTYGALFGEIEHRSELGAAVTDFTLIEAGALHRANGGYLVLDARRSLLQPYVWEELKRCLRSRTLRTESLAHRLGLSSQTGLEPEPIPLDVKVILLGERDLYYLLLRHDPELLELFKIAADFEDGLERSPETEREHAGLIATLARSRGTRPLDAEAAAAVIEESARATGDARRLSLNAQAIGDLVDEADSHAAAAGHALIGEAEVRLALEGRERRAARMRDRALERLRRRTLLIETAGAKVGQVNGLTVIGLGDFSFGQPSCITARVRVGGGEVVDIEREVELGGPIHSKGVLILSGYLGGRYAADRPLSLTASLVFEQSYGPIEGDSASAAELCALLSALAELPVRQALGVTGSVNQHGVVQPVGGVNEKIEGFFDACRAREGRVAGHGVLIPASNVQHLMLRADVVEAVRQGRFSITPIASIDEAIELLTGVPAGERRADGQFPDTSVHGRVERRLALFARRRQAYQSPGAPPEPPARP